MKTNLLSLLAAATSAALVLPLSAQNRPHDLRTEDREAQPPIDLRDLTLVPGEADHDEEWDMVRRLERERQDQSVDAMIRRMVRELETDIPQSDTPNRNRQDMKERDQSPKPQRQMNDTPDWQRPTWFIGLMVEPMEPFMREHLGLEAETGVKVTRVLEGSPAAKAGIRLNDIIFKAKGKNVSSLDDLKSAVEKAGKEGKPLEIAWIQKGERKTAVLRPNGPPRPDQTQRADKPANPAMPGIERRMTEMMKRLDRQQKEIEALRRQVGELRQQRMRRNHGNEASPNPRSR